MGNAQTETDSRSGSDGAFEGAAEDIAKKVAPDPAAGATGAGKSARIRSETAAAADTLSRALPYLQRYDGATVVIKLGGHAMGSDAAMDMFARDVALMRQVGVNPVVVHGGGPMINAMLEKLGIESSFIDGKRVTDKATVEVVEMVLSGAVNKRIVQAINRQGGMAVGVSGKDANLMICDQTDPELGFVGEPRKMNPALLRNLFRDDMIPVVAPLGAGPSGETLNVNGDTAAGAIAGALKANRLLLLTDVPGILNSDGDLVEELTAARLWEMIGDGDITGGMIPKTETALDSLQHGVRGVVILDGRVRSACLLELFTEHGIGTLIRAQ